MLLINKYVFGALPLKTVGGVSVSQTREAKIASGPYRNRFAHFPMHAGHPYGYFGESTNIQPMKSGGISSFTDSRSAVAAAANLAGGRNLVGSATLVIVVDDAQLDRIVSAEGSSTISISVDTAQLAAAAGAAASGNMSITVDNALCGAIFSVTASGTLAITANDKFLTALAHIEADAGGPTPLSPEGLAAAVWEALATDYNEAGTMGEKLNDAGSAGNPWAALTADNNDPGTFGERVQKLLKTIQFLGFK